MKGKISKIKNTKGELALPVTTVEAIYLEDGKTKLSDEIKDVLKYEVLDDEGIIAEIPGVIKKINGIEKDISEINSSLDNMEDKKATRQEVDIERKRIDSFTKLSEGSTTGDAELIDIRVNSNGISYANAGESVRAINNNFASHLNMVDELKKSFGNIDYIPVKYTVNNNGYYNKDFELVPATSSNIILSVLPNEIYRFKVHRNYNHPIYFLLDNDKLLFAEKNASGEIYNDEEFEIQIPYGCNKIAIQSQTEYGYKYILKVDKINVSDIETSQIKENAITYNLLEDGIKDLIIPSYKDVTDINWIDGYYINSNALLGANGGYSYCKYPVIKGQKFRLSSKRQWDSCGWVILDNLGLPIKTDEYPTSTETSFVDEITIPNEGKYLCFNKSNNDSFKFLQVEGRFTLKKQEILYSDLPSQLTDIFDLAYQTLTPTWVLGGYMTENGGVLNTGGDENGYAEFPVREGDIFRITGEKGWHSICYLVKDINDRVILHDGRPTDVATKIINEVFTIPKDGVKLFIGKYGFKELACKNKVVVSGTVSPLANKKILFNGDSICQGVVNGGGYAKIIKDLTGCLIENRAVGGGTLTTGDNTKHRIVDDIENMSDIADIVCFEGGINDYWGKRTLGTMTPMNDWTSELDESTIIGALESIFRKSLIKWEGTPICMIFTHPILTTRWNTGYSGGHTMEQQTEALKEVCKKYSIPFVDLMNESGGFNCNLDYIAAKYTTNSDGCHPNEVGYKRFYVPQIIKMFEKLITID
jgi:lysophospholipase L1-like esterase